MSFQKNRTSIIILFLLIVGYFLRFYNLTWGAPYFFHPDERNIASAVSQMTFPINLNPHFFAYGGLPIYVIFFSGTILNLIQSTFQPVASLNQVNFENAIMISRFYSALFSTLLIPAMFFIGKKIFNERCGVIAAGLTTFCVGFIQFAHFGTFEMWLTFFTLLLFWMCINFSYSLKYFFFCGILVGVLIAVKVSSMVILPLPLLPAFFYFLKQLNGKNIRLRNIFRLCFYFLVFIFSAVFVYLISNPYVVLDFAEFKNSMGYESGVALGTLPVFYTGEFTNSVPVIFQALRVFPFLLNPVAVILFLPLLAVFGIYAARKKNFELIILLLFFLVCFLSQAFLFVKWVRYMVPSVPFIILILSCSIEILRGEFKNKFININIYWFLMLSSIVFSMSYFLTTYVQKDSRFEALEYAKRNIPSSSLVLSEVYDLGIVPFNEYYPSISLFNFYDLDLESTVYTQSALEKAIQDADFIILPSQRLVKVRVSQPKTFPLGSKFYMSLLSGEMGFNKIYETPCDLLCKISYLTDPIYSYEQTANVFDRPRVMIFKKK